jgi:hypothetical protein
MLLTSGINNLLHGWSIPMPSDEDILRVEIIFTVLSKIDDQECRTGKEAGVGYYGLIQGIIPTLIYNK